jgi:hypothetical protein
VWFDIVQYGSTKSKKVTLCHCPYDEKHFLIEYTVKHAFTSQRMDCTSQQLQNSFIQFLSTCDRLTHFLRQNGLINKIDPFSSVLNRFIDEEKQVRENSGGTFSIHEEVHKVICSLPGIRENNSKKLNRQNEKLSLPEVHTLIAKLMSTPEIKQQIECIKITRRSRMDKTEHKVTIPSTKNKSFVELMN